MQRLTTPIMTSVSKRVPIPRNGVDYRSKIVLAPMVGRIIQDARKVRAYEMQVRSGELPSRLLALHYGANLVWGRSVVVEVYSCH